MAASTDAGQDKKLKEVGAHLYKKPPDKQAMQFFGLTEDDYADENICFVWPCNLSATNIFVALSTQWLCGPCGAYGLNYSVLYQKLDRLKLAPEVCEQIEDDIRTLEDSALEQMRKED